MRKDNSFPKDNSIGALNGNTTPSAPPIYTNRGRPPRGGSSFLARFGEVIVRHGVAAIPAALFHYQGKLELTAQEVWFISAVLSRKWTEDLPHPNLSRMEKQTGILERRLRRYKQALYEAGYLQVYPRYDDTGRQDSNYYDFSALFEEIESLIKADAPQTNSISANQPEESGDEATIKIEDIPDTSFVARFGSVIVSRGIAAVPQALFTYQGNLNLTPQQVWFICYIFSVPWSPSYPYPSLLKMAARTGYSKMQLHEIKNSLAQQGFLRIVHRTKDDGGQDSNGYDFAGLFTALRNRLQPDSTPEPPTSDNTTPPDAPRSRRAPRQGKAGALKRASQTRNQAVTQLTGQEVKELTRVTVTRLTEEADNRLTPPVNPTPATSLSPTLPRRRSHTVHKIEPSVIETKKRYDSNHISPKKDENTQIIDTVTSRYSPYISAIITDFSDELGDSPHIVSNVTQALRLYTTSGLQDEEFAELLFQARKLVRSYQGKQGLRTINNKMSYFFIVLRDLLSKPSP